MPVKIRKWNVAESLYCSPLNTVADAVVAGLAEGVSFKDADFRGVEFDYTDLSGAKFVGADRYGDIGLGRHVTSAVKANSFMNQEVDA